mmetsp:Transcript_36475/g.90931  ORF Transcript_36475/g.90931 Transcript_36475/m.90931 type:complete len:100 (-) Transcript_36475:489-788(-)
MSSLKEILYLNKYAVLVTSDVFHPGISVFPAAPQSAGFTMREQHASPDGTVARQLSTAAFRAVRVRNGDEKEGLAAVSRTQTPVLSLPDKLHELGPDNV